MPTSPRYLTKSRFVMALECPTKLYYADRPDEFPNRMNEDTFLFELAKGGMQVGELAKFNFVDDPVSSKITIDFNRDHAKSLDETRSRMKQKSKVIIAEASFLYNNCFARADIIIKREDDIIELFEVKAKSFLEGDDKLSSEKTNKITSEWSPYLYDVAFQKWVIEKSTGKKVLAHLVVVDKGTVASVQAMPKNFNVNKDENERPIVEIKKGLTKSDLGNSILRVINVDKECEIIYNAPLPLSISEKFTFTAGIEFLTANYEKDEKLSSLPTSRCRDCEFNASVGQMQAGKKSAIKECWIKNGFVSVADFDNESLVLELWSGNSGSLSPVSKLINLKKFLLKDASRGDFDSKKEKGEDGITPHERREIQITKAKSKEVTPFIDQKGLERTFKEWKFPYHFIDFETSATALPWFIGCRPYEPIAFQFSHHILQEDGSCAHANQYLSFEPGAFPNFDFLRALKASLEKDDGTIFRYHSHENNYLRFIKKQLISRDTPDKQELISFIDNITERDEVIDGNNKRVFGNRSMVDLYKVVLKYYYSPFAKGSNSLKQILPAAINDFVYLKEKYGKPIYGKGLQIESLNFENKTWVEERFQFDPYRTLEPVFKDYPTEQLDRLVEDMEEVGDGGSAMMAYNMLQYSEIPLDQRTRIKEALYQYCELDTMAMVMLYEGLKSTL